MVNKWLYKPPKLYAIFSLKWDAVKLGVNHRDCHFDGKVAKEIPLYFWNKATTTWKNSCLQILFPGLFLKFWPTVNAVKFIIYICMYFKSTFGVSYYAAVSKWPPRQRLAKSEFPISKFASFSLSSHFSRCDPLFFIH